MHDTEEIISRLSSISGGYKSASDSFFHNANKYLPKFVKKGGLTVGDEEIFHTKNQIYCNEPGCQLMFDSTFSYQCHYNSLHRYKCSHCNKNLPTSHLLDLHLSETHDSYFAVLAENKPMYSCFLEECCFKAKTPKDRKNHCIVQHKFPSDFRFDNPAAINKKVFALRNSRLDEDMDTEQEISHAPKQLFRFNNSKTKTFNKDSYAKYLTKKNVEYHNSLEDSKTVKDLLDNLPT